MRLGFSKLLGKLAVKYVSTYTKSTLKKDQPRTYLMMLMQCVSVFLSLYNGICCGYPFELHRLVDAIQMGIHNICRYKETDKKYTGCNLKTTELLDCALIGVWVVIRLNTVFSNIRVRKPGIHFLPSWTETFWYHFMTLTCIFTTLWHY